MMWEGNINPVTTINYVVYNLQDRRLSRVKIDTCQPE